MYDDIISPYEEDDKYRYYTPTGGNKECRNCGNNLDCEPEVALNECGDGYERWDEKVCSKCIHSKWDETRPNIVPSIHICYNKESEYYEWPQAWSSTCDKFVRKVG